ncbi:hypothetical protein AVEN_954-1 [Araneus ventricosus]|uniref:Uncharacterized protein n=1 Tax=Araneus ventricosus TaxID=182803 RepID=A0A4Y2CY28_ARAVE|nr:hypothetical protein AVEN_954-1 [Araneus ventricosus]
MKPFHKFHPRHSLRFGVIVFPCKGTGFRHNLIHFHSICVKNNMPSFILPPGGTTSTWMRNRRISKRVLDVDTMMGGAKFLPPVIVRTSFGRDQAVAVDSF